ncbi:MAG TPA: adaptor protein MecA [Oscillospiraceae bacterium]|nr:adaptor protein MecA [Oscillospiraceae bacterium]
MKIELQNEDKIVVELTKTDLKSLDITYEDMDYSNIETRRVIWTLLDEAKRVLGKDISPAERMLIEALPLEDGGCVLYFTVLPSSGYDKSSKRLVMKKEAEPILLYTKDCNSFIDSVGILKEMSGRHKGYSSYILSDAYYTVVYPKLTQSDYFVRGLCEYCDIVDADMTKISQVSEYGEYLKSFSERVDCKTPIISAENIASCN